jgi:hypothetical protein
MGFFDKVREKIRNSRATPPPGGVNWNIVMTDRYMENKKKKDHGSFSANFKNMLQEEEGNTHGFEIAKWSEKKEKEEQIEEEQQAVEEAARQAANAPKPIPLPDDEYIRTQRKKALARQRRRGGRMSTILTPNEDREPLG